MGSSLLKLAKTISLYITPETAHRLHFPDDFMMRLIVLAIKRFLNIYFFKLWQTFTVHTGVFLGKFNREGKETNYMGLSMILIQCNAIHLSAGEGLELGLESYNQNKTNPLLLPIF